MKRKYNVVGIPRYNTKIGKAWTNSCSITTYFVQYLGTPAIHFISFLAVYRENIANKYGSGAKLAQIGFSKRDSIYLRKSAKRCTSVRACTSKHPKVNKKYVHHSKAVNKLSQWAWGKQEAWKNVWYLDLPWAKSYNPSKINFSKKPLLSKVRKRGFPGQL